MVKQLVLVAVVAAVFGASFGYLGTNFQTSWVTGVAQAQDTEVSQKQDGSLKDRVARLERELGNNPQRIQWRFHENVYKRIDRLESKARELDSVIHSQPGTRSGLEDRIYQVEARLEHKIYQLESRLGVWPLDRR